ncbi:MAG: glycosyltransferase [Simkaniaceae bacterium]
MKRCVSFSLFLFLWNSFLFGGEQRFVIVTASYNNEAFCKNNILSALNQKYDKYRIIYINDASTDQTLEIIQKIVAQKQKEHLVTIIDNPKRQRALANYTNAIHLHVEDDEIVVILDGDDRLANENVLSYLDKVYSKNDIWLTYGQFIQSYSGERGWCRPMPKKIVKENAFRQWQDGPTHLRTFYAWLFKAVSIDDLMLGGHFYQMTGDLAMMLPMIEMARDHFHFVSKVLYQYNDGNPLNDHKVSRQIQMLYDEHIRALPPYTPLPHRLDRPCLKNNCHHCKKNRR